MATLIEVEAITQAFVDEAQELVREKCAAAQVLPMVPARGENSTTGTEQGQIVSLACALAGHAIDAVFEVAPDDDVALAGRCLTQVQGWLDGERAKPSFRRLDRRIKRARKALKKHGSQQRAECVRVWHSGGNHRTDLGRYVDASVGLLHAMAQLEAVSAARVAVRMASGRSRAVAKLVGKVGHVQARLVVATFIAESWVSARALDFGELVGALECEHALDYPRKCWVMSCRGVDVLEHAAGTAAIDVTTDSAMEYIQGGMAVASPAPGSSGRARV